MIDRDYSRINKVQSKLLGRQCNLLGWRRQKVSGRGKMFHGNAAKKASRATNTRSSEQVSTTLDTVSSTVRIRSLGCAIPRRIAPRLPTAMNSVYNFREKIRD